MFREIFGTYGVCRSSGRRALRRRRRGPTSRSTALHLHPCDVPDDLIVGQIAAAARERKAVGSASSAVRALGLERTRLAFGIRARDFTARSPMGKTLHNFF